VKTVSGGSTGTYNIDTNSGSPNSNAVPMSSWIPLKDFESSVVHHHHGRQQASRGQVTTDYGQISHGAGHDKVKGQTWLRSGQAGRRIRLAQKWKDGGGNEIKVGNRVEIYYSNLDMSTNCYDWYASAKGNDIVDVWSIMGRGGAAQR